MNLSKNSLAGLGSQLDLANTINGGVTLTSFKIQQNEDGYIVTLQNPGFDQDNYHVELKADRLTIYTTLNSTEDTKIKKPIVPTFLRHLPVPAHVDTDRIEAIFEEDYLKIIAPFKPGFDSSSERMGIRY